MQNADELSNVAMTKFYNHGDAIELARVEARAMCVYLYRSHPICNSTYEKENIYRFRNIYKIVLKLPPNRDTGM